MQERDNAVENENVVTPVSEKYMSIIREASVYFNIRAKRCGGWKRITPGVLQF